jgi:hypothetical protein
MYAQAFQDLIVAVAALVAAAAPVAAVRASQRNGIPGAMRTHGISPGVSQNTVFVFTTRGLLKKGLKHENQVKYARRRFWLNPLRRQHPLWRQHTLRRYCSAILISLKC